jgi:hypothetical protein
MNLQPAPGIGKEARFSEPIHEKTDAQTGCACHSGEGLLTDLGDDSIGRAFLAEMSAREQNPS